MCGNGPRWSWWWGHDQEMGVALGTRGRGRSGKGKDGGVGTPGVHCWLACLGLDQDPQFPGGARCTAHSLQPSHMGLGREPSFDAPHLVFGIPVSRAEHRSARCPILEPRWHTTAPLLWPNCTCSWQVGRAACRSTYCSHVSAHMRTRATLPFTSPRSSRPLLALTCPDLASLCRAGLCSNIWGGGLQQQPPPA